MFCEQINAKRICDPVLEAMSAYQLKLRLEIKNCKEMEKVAEMKKDRNEILKELSKRVKRMKEKEVDRIVTEIDTIKDDAKMYEAVCILNKKPPENSYVHDKHRRCVSNIQSMNEIINGHFKEHF